MFGKRGKSYRKESQANLNDFKNFDETDPSSDLLIY